MNEHEPAERKWMQRYGVSQKTVRELISAVTYGHPESDLSLKDSMFLSAYAAAMTRLIIDRMSKLERRQSMKRMTIAEAAKVSGRSIATIKRAIRARRLLSEKVGGRRYIDRESFEAYFERDLMDVYEIHPRRRKRKKKPAEAEDQQPQPL